MADEITVSCGLKVVNGTLRSTEPTYTAQFDQTTARGGGPGTVDIGTSEETISFGDIAPGYVQLINLDATNFVTFGSVTAQLNSRLDAAGGCALFKMVSATSLIMKADTAGCKVQIRAVNI